MNLVLLLNTIWEMQERTSDLIYKTKPWESDCYELVVSWLSKTPVIFKNSDDRELKIWFSVIRCIIFTFPDDDVFNHEGWMTGSVLCQVTELWRALSTAWGKWSCPKGSEISWDTKPRTRSEELTDSKDLRTELILLKIVGQVKALISVSTRDLWRRLALSNNLTLSHQCLVTSGSMKPTWQKPKLMVRSQKGNFQCEVYSMQYDSRVKISILVLSKLLLTNLLYRQLAFTSF